MEFDIEKNKVVGIVDQRKGKESASIKVVGYINTDKKCILFSEEETQILFPPYGFVFEPGFFINFNTFSELDMICFKVTVNPKSTSSDDLYQILSNTNNTVKCHGYMLIHDNQISYKDNFLDLSDFDTSLLTQKDSFYIEHGQAVFGDFKLKNEHVVNGSFNKTHAWSKKDCFYYNYKGHGYLLQKPDTNFNAKIVDTLNNIELAKWFRKKLKLINSETVKNLNELFQLEGIAEIFNESSDSQLELDKIRLKRIEKSFSNYNLLVTDINYLVNISDNLKEQFNKALIQYKDEIIQRFSKEFDELEKKNHSASFDIEKKQHQLEVLNNEVIEKNTQIDLLLKSKERILSDFSIIKEVLGGSISQTEQVQSNSFVIETIIPEENTPLIEKKDKFLARLRHILSEQKNSSLAANLLVAIATFKGTFISDEQIALALIEAAGNCKYIIQQVEPDWLHFKDLWNNGLGAIWKSSHENPNVLHLLVLEDINLSSPECYMRPLLDCMNGIRKRIPFAMNEFPENLRILATKISSEEPKIGLPLLKQTFKNWAAVGFTNTSSNSEQKYSTIDGYVSSETFLAFKSTEPKDEYSEKFVVEYKKLFDRPE